MSTRRSARTATSSRSRNGTSGPLSHLPKADFANDYAYNKFAPGPFGIRAGMGAAATITLPKPESEAALTDPVTLTMTDVDGRVFRVRLRTSP